MNNVSKPTREDFRDLPTLITHASRINDEINIADPDSIMEGIKAIETVFNKIDEIKIRYYILLNKSRRNRL